MKTILLKSSISVRKYLCPPIFWYVHMFQTRNVFASFAFRFIWLFMMFGIRYTYSSVVGNHEYNPSKNSYFPDLDVLASYVSFCSSYCSVVANCSSVSSYLLLLRMLCHRPPLLIFLEYSEGRLF